MRVGIMQPYFLPYIGYWQLIKACDLFILNDDVQFIRHGWIARNRILKPSGGWQYVIVPLKRHAHDAAIGLVEIDESRDWRGRMLRQLGHYRRRAPFGGEMLGLVEELLALPCRGSIALLNLAILQTLAPRLGITTPIVLQSGLGLDYSAIRETADWSLDVTRQMGGDTYVNPVSGGGLYDAKQFRAAGITLELLTPTLHSYPQGAAFEAALSILDVLMFLGWEETASRIESYGVAAAE